MEPCHVDKIGSSYLQYFLPTLFPLVSQDSPSRKWHSLTLVRNELSQNFTALSFSIMYLNSEKSPQVKIYHFNMPQGGDGKQEIVCGGATVLRSPLLLSCPSRLCVCVWVTVLQIICCCGPLKRESIDLNQEEKLLLSAVFL